MASILNSTANATISKPTIKRHKNLRTGDAPFQHRDTCQSAPVRFIPLTQGKNLKNRTKGKKAV